MFIRTQTTTLLQIFCELSLCSHVIFISMKVADVRFWWSSKCEWVDSNRPLTIVLRAAKTGLTHLEIYYLQKHFLENIWRRNVYQRPNYNSPSNILWTFALFASYFQKYESSRRVHVNELIVTGHSPLCSGLLSSSIFSRVWVPLGTGTEGAGVLWSGGTTDSAATKQAATELID